MSFLEFVEGPFFYLAAAVFVFGALWRFFGIIRIGRKKDISPAKGSEVVGFIRGNLRHFVPRGIFTKRTALHIIGGYGFHIGLFVLVFFAAPHIKFIDTRILGINWPAMPHWGFVVAAEFAFAGLVVLWVRRISDPVMRLISDKSDHLGTILTFLLMFTGCLAMQESHEVLRAIHMGTLDIWLLYFPFSRLMHAFTFVLARGNTGATYGRKGMSL